MADVFISYSRKDKSFVQRLNGELTRRDREAWVDWEGIRPTEEFMLAIYAAIESANTFIFVLSPDSVTSVVCGQEIAHAAAHNKRMVPLVARDVNATEVPPALAKLNWIFCRESDDFDRAAETLIGALDTDLDWVRAHTRLVTRAVEWEAKKKNNSFVLRGDDLREAEQWLTVAGAQKERQPTALQTEYIFTSRRAATRRQRITLGAVACGAVIALVLAVVAWTQRTRAIKQEKETRRTAVQADFDLAMLHRGNSDDAIDPRTLAHLVRALRTDPSAALPRQYLVSILRDRNWFLPLTDPLPHEGEVFSANFSPDGKRLVTASHDKTARLWNAESGRPIGEPLKHWTVVHLAEFSPDGARLATAFSYSVRIWDAGNGKPIIENINFKSRVNSVKFNRDGSLLLIAAGNTAQIYETTTGKSVEPPMSHGASVATANFNADESMIVTGAYDKAARLWNAKNGEAIGKPLEHEGAVVDASFSPDMRLIATASHDGFARLWNAQSGALIGKPMRHNEQVNTAVFSPDCIYLLTSSNDKTVRLWKTETAEEVFEIEPMRHESQVEGATFSPDGSRILAYCWDGATHMWDVLTGKRAGEPMRHDNHTNSARFSPDGKRVVTASRDRTARIWDAEESRAKWLNLQHGSAVKTVAFCADGQKLVTTARDGKTRIWNTNTGRLQGNALPHGGASATFSPDGRWILTASSNEKDKTAKVWNAETGEPLPEPMLHADRLWTAMFSPDGARILTASADRTARLWDGQTHKLLGATTKQDENVLATCFSPDGTRIATASGKLARLWSGHDATLIGDPMGHKANIKTVNFSPDGKFLVTASEDTTARIWDAYTGRPVGGAMDHDGPVRFALFTPDGNRIVTATDGGSGVSSWKGQLAWIWDANTRKLASPPLSHEVDVSSACSSVDGRTVTVSWDAKARFWDSQSGQPAGEFLLHDAQLEDATFSPDGRRLATALHEDSARIWDVAVDYSSPLPPWFLEFAETVGSRRLSAQGSTLAPEKSIGQIRREVLALQGDDFWTRFGHWFFTRGSGRTISPNSKVTLGELHQLQADAAEKQKADAAAASSPPQ